MKKSEKFEELKKAIEEKIFVSKASAYVALDDAFNGGQLGFDEHRELVSMVCRQVSKYDHNQKEGEK